MRHKTPAPPAAVNPGVDARFVTIGRAYLPGLAKALADSYESGEILDAGGTIENSIDVIASSWATNRTNLYNATVTPRLSEIVPPGTAPTDVTAAQRAAIAAAYRGFGKGLAP